MKVNARDWLTTTMTVAILALLTFAASVNAEAATGPNRLDRRSPATREPDHEHHRWHS